MWLDRETHLRTTHSRMLCGPQIGRFLTTFCELHKPKKKCTGVRYIYRILCNLPGFRPLPKGGHLDAVEINDELEGLIMEGFRRGGVEEKISLIIGDAMSVVPALSKVYDLVYIDANKEYPEYYEMVMEVLRPGGYIIADNVLWDGKVYMDNPPADKQTRGIMEFNRIVKKIPGWRTIFFHSGMVLISLKSYDCREYLLILNLHFVSPPSKVKILSSPLNLSPLKIYCFASWVNLCGKKWSGDSLIYYHSVRIQTSGEEPSESHHQELQKLFQMIDQPVPSLSLHSIPLPSHEDFCCRGASSIRSPILLRYTRAPCHCNKQQGYLATVSMSVSQYIFGYVFNC